ncbi:MAG: bifunctional 4-hydroxy-2-oxoglutarate aldolase/2-dehydro-3-deoxy-phosphogluconate aldolase [Mycobacteriales bacterium]
MSWPAELPIVPVVTVSSVAEAVLTAKQLAADGMPVIEVTLRTSDALQAISAIRAELPDVFCGAGTLRGPADVAAAVEAGSQFLVSPGSTDALLDAMVDSGLLFLPGAATPTEAMRLLDRGITLAKFFPAEASGGVAALRALAGPLPMQWCATGGISAASAQDYLALPNVVAVGGSWMVRSALS